MVDFVMLPIVAGSPDGFAPGQLKDLSVLPPRVGKLPEGPLYLPKARSGSVTPFARL